MSASAICSSRIEAPAGHGGLAEEAQHPLPPQRCGASNSIKRSVRLLPCMDIMAQVSNLLFSRRLATNCSSSSKEEDGEVAVEECGLHCANQSLAYSLAVMNVLHTVMNMFPGQLAIRYTDPDDYTAHDVAESKSERAAEATSIGLVVHKCHLHRVELSDGAILRRRQLPDVSACSAESKHPKVRSRNWHYYVVLECGSSSFVSFDLTSIQFGGVVAGFHNASPLDGCYLRNHDSVPDNLASLVHGNGGLPHHSFRVPRQTRVKWARTHKGARRLIAGFSGTSLNNVRWFHPVRTIQ